MLLANQPEADRPTLQVRTSRLFVTIRQHGLACRIPDPVLVNPMDTPCDTDTAQQQHDRFT